MNLHVFTFIILQSIYIGLSLANNTEVNTDLNENDLRNLEKFVDLINFYRLIRNETDDEVEDFYHQQHEEQSDNEELMERGPHCAHCNRHKIHDSKYALEAHTPNRIPSAQRPTIKPSRRHRPRPKPSKPHEEHEKMAHSFDKYGITIEGGLFLAFGDAVPFKSGFIVPVYETYILNSKEYKKYKKTQHLLTWADKVQEKTEDACVIYAICQLGLRPNDFGRLGDDLRRLIRRPTIYVLNIIRRYATAINVQLGNINFGACKEEFQACLISTDKQHLVDIGFPVRGVFTTQ